MKARYIPFSLLLAVFHVRECVRELVGTETHSFLLGIRRHLARMLLICKRVRRSIWSYQYNILKCVIVPILSCAYALPPLASAKPPLARRGFFCRREKRAQEESLQRGGLPLRFYSFEGEEFTCLVFRGLFPREPRYGRQRLYGMPSHRVLS
ncbi:hypothetical protein EI42_03759 [Thermosporothrix hazakensis]|uniref:Uncharacterized protein n=1 Tax=Thermosporothrix hazakensis TaxID=644383 RepID=A0A326U4F4_THEHA|nr:hypothetical protein EI42_03759 [Thermosporothrix hazakensis]